MSIFKTSTRPLAKTESRHKTQSIWKAVSPLLIRDFATNPRLERKRCHFCATAAPGILFGRKYQSSS